MSNVGQSVNVRIEAVRRVIAKRKARGAGAQDIEQYKESITKGIKHEECRQLILNIN